MNTRPKNNKKQITLFWVWVLAFSLLTMSGLDSTGIMFSTALADCQNEYHWLEAECGNISSPGEVETDVAASEGRYITTPHGSGRYIDHDAGPTIATYDYTLNYDCGEHHLWARVKYDSGEHNSVWVQFDNSNDFEWRFSDHQTGHWHWEKMGLITGLKQRPHQLFLKLREEQTQIDKLLITSDLHYVPSDLGEPAENACFHQPPQHPDPDPQPNPIECDLCDPLINLGDLVVIKSKPNSIRPSLPAIVIGKKQDVLIVLTHREAESNEYSLVNITNAFAGIGQGFPWENTGIRLATGGTMNVSVAEDDPRLIAVTAWNTRQYIDCRGLIDIDRDASVSPVRYTGSMSATQGWTGDIEFAPGLDPSSASFTDSTRVRLQGLLGYQENTIQYPLISTTDNPIAREGEVVIRDYRHPDDPRFDLYNLGVIDCWNLDTNLDSSILVLTGLTLTQGFQAFQVIDPTETDSLSAACIKVHLKPSFYDNSDKRGDIISYVCTPCGVIERISGGNTYQAGNDNFSDSHYALVFESPSKQCYVLPKKTLNGNWSDLVGKPYRLTGFREAATPADVGFEDVYVTGSRYERLGFLTAPVVLFPCTGNHPPTNYSLTVSAGPGGTVTTPGIGTFQYPANSTASLQAVANNGYEFVRWEIVLDAAWTDNNAATSVVMTTNGTAKAVFRQKHTSYYALTVSAGPGGTVTTPGIGTFQYPANSTASLQAVANNGYDFVRWEIVLGAPSIENNASTTITVTTNGTARAIFEKKHTNYTVTVSAGPGGTVSNPGIGTFQYPENASATFQAVANFGYQFDQWSVTVSGSTFPVNFEAFQMDITGNTTVHATFKQVSTHKPNLTDGGIVYRDIHPQIVHRGDTVNISFRLKNDGSATADDGTGHIKIMYYASTDSHITSSDYPLEDERTWTLNAGFYRDITVPIQVPHSVPAGHYYIGWIIDPDNDIDETNEHDNTAYKTGKMLQVQ